MIEMKLQLFLIAFITGLSVISADFAVSAALDSNTVAAGEVVKLTFTMNRQPDSRIQLPPLDNGRWLTNMSSQGTRIVNGEVTHTLSVGVLPEHSGTLTIPPITFSAGGETAETREIVARVVPPEEKTVSTRKSGNSSEMTLGEAIQGSISIPGDRTSYYVGEEIPLELRLLVHSGAPVRSLGYPELSGMADAVFSDFPNQENRRFAEPRRQHRIIDGREYVEFIFRTAFRIMKPGRVTPEASCIVGIVQRSQNRHPLGFPFDDDDFFSNFFSGIGQETTPYEVKFQPLEHPVEIKPLPPAPAGAANLRLIGNWRMSAQLSRPSARVGEPIELLIELRGDSSGESVNAPALKFPGFRVYPPEVRKSFGTVELRYALIPLESGEKELRAAFAIFDSAAGEYRISDFKLQLPVSPGEVPAGNATIDDAGAGTAIPEPAVAEAPKPPPREQPFWQKSYAGSPVLLPLWRNQLVWMLIFVVGGPVAGIVIEIFARRREKLANDPALRARRERARKLPELLKKLNRESVGEDLLRGSIVPFLAEAMELPPGTTAAELAEHLDDPELRRLFLDSDAAGFRPEQQYAPDGVRFSPETLRKLRRLLKKFSAVILLISALPIAANALEIDNSAFSAGEFQRAADDYRRQLGRSAAQPELLYNLGGAAWQLNDLPTARWAFNRALLLAPGDHETRENLNLVNRKLLQPEEGATTTLAELLRTTVNRLRPDHYLLIAAAAFALLCIGVGLRRSFSRGWLISAAALLGLVMVASLFIAGFQCRDAYDPRRATVITPSLELRSLPSSGAGKIEAAIPGGASVLVLDRNGDWLRIRVNGRDGWAKKSDIGMLLPEGLFGGNE